MGFSTHLSTLARITLLGALAIMTSPAALITFDSLDTSGGPVETYTESGATFSAGNKDFTVTTGVQTASVFADEGRSLRTAGSPMPTMRADLTGLVGYVSVELGDMGFDADLLFLRAYADDGGLLQEAQLQTDTSNAMLNELFVFVPNISYVVFGGIVNGSSSSSVYADNFYFGAAPPGVDGGEIPEPATIVLFAAGLGAIGFLRRRR